MKAAIDIGTNTVLLLVAEVKGEELKTIHEEQRIPRLGRGVDEIREISEAATKRVVDVLKEYKLLLKTRFPLVEEVVVTATSAVRDAANKEVFIQRVKQETDFDIRLLSGAEEAEWTAKGALSMLPSYYDDEAMILDIGGGSTEIALVEEGKLIESFSFNMGSVRFTEKFLLSNPPGKDMVDLCRESIIEFFSGQVIQPTSKSYAIGVAGTVTSLAAMLLNMEEYQSAEVNGYEIQLKDIESYIKILSNKTHQEILQEYPNILAGRADIFLAGLLVLEGFMKQYEFEEIVVSTGGIRHGALTI